MTGYVVASEMADMVIKVSGWVGLEVRGNEMREYEDFLPWIYRHTNRGDAFSVLQHQPSRI